MSLGEVEKDSVAVRNCAKSRKRYLNAPTYFDGACSWVKWSEGQMDVFCAAFKL